MLENIYDNLEFVALFVGIILLTILLAYIVNRISKRIIKKSTESLNNDPTNYQFLRHLLVGMIYIIGFSIAIYMMPNLRALAGSLLAGAGILAVAVGFASQHALSNIISGVFIVIFKPFRVNDRITLQTMSGVVEDITLRHVVIRDFENRRILVPNSVISNEIIVNADIAEEKICKWVDISISYDSDIDLARQIMREEIMIHPLLQDNRNAEQLEQGRPQVEIRVIALAESSVNLRAWAWTNNNADAFALGCDVMESIKKRFDQAGVEIPYPHRTIVNKAVARD